MMIVTMKMVSPSDKRMRWSNDWNVCEDGWWIDVIIVLPCIAHSWRTSINATADVLSKPDGGSTFIQITYNHLYSTSDTNIIGVLAHSWIRNWSIIYSTWASLSCFYERFSNRSKIVYVIWHVLPNYGVQTSARQT
jgi:hypothetical protein